MAAFNMLTPDASGTGLLLAGIMLAWLLGNGESTSGALRTQAIVLGIAIGGSLTFDLRHGLRNLVRVDVIAMLAFYVLTFVEFLFPQPDFDGMNQPQDVGRAAQAVLLAMAGIVAGRHVTSGIKRKTPGGVMSAGLSVGQWLALLWIAAGLGYLHMLISVNFNPIELFEAMMRPRFNQPWGRGKFGDWKALITELSLFSYVIPPIYGILLANRRKISSPAMIAATALVIFVLFQGFTSGTRNIFLIYVAGLASSYLLSHQNLSWKRAMIVASVSIALIYIGTTQMLAFRQIGLKNYLNGVRHVGTAERFVVDYNLVSMARIMEVFPERHSYLGLEIPYQALIRPIPRAIWPGKPEGLSISIEEASGMEGLTIAVTFAGEAYMSGGLVAVFVTALILGFFCAWWNRSFRGRFDLFSQLIYASGFFPAAITMRSLLWLTTAMLPTIGLLVISYLLSKYSANGARRRRAPVRRPQVPLPRPAQAPPFPLDDRDDSSSR